MSHLVGEALTTMFTMQATEGWSDPDGDSLTFQFSYTNDVNGNIYKFVPQEDDSFSTTLPTGNICYFESRPFRYWIYIYFTNFHFTLVLAKVFTNKAFLGSGSNVARLISESDRFMQRFYKVCILYVLLYVGWINATWLQRSRFFLYQ